MNFSSTDPVEQFMIEVHNLRDRDGRIGGYRLGEDLPDEIRIAQILVAKIAAMEREACAKVCEVMTPTDADGFCPVAAAIRARGNEK